MRLGVWNRLAIVGAGLFSLGGGTWMVVSDNIERAKIQESGYASCIAAVAEPNSNLSYEFCRKIWLTTQSSLGWNEWAQAVAACAFAAAFVYLLILMAVVIAKWIWRGRTGAELKQPVGEGPTKHSGQKPNSGDPRENVQKP